MKSSCEYRLLDGWRFHLGDIPFPEVSGHQQSYASAKTGSAAGAAAEFFDDSAWQSVTVPHDWVIAQPFDTTANLAQGYRRGGVAWYRRYFHLPSNWERNHVKIEFDGIATHATVWLNGALLHRSFSGSTPFVVEIGPFVHFGDRSNTLAVRVDAVAREGWWYEGGGIYRGVTLRVQPPLHLVNHETWIRPELRTGGQWTVQVAGVVRNTASDTRRCRVRARLRDAAGVVVARGTRGIAALAWRSEPVAFQLPVDHPCLWSPESPTLYHLEIEMVSEDGWTDRTEWGVGFRTMAFDANRGFLLNGAPYTLQGVCCHQDHAGVGVAVPRSLLEFRLQKLKELGANAYRCAHHPPDAHLLDLCDRLGMLVLDEARVFSSAEFALRDLEAMVRRDRNHPCVFLWSIGNEEFLQASRAGVEIVRRMMARVRAFDPTRLVTVAMNGGLFAARNLGEALDVVGFNYYPAHYDRYHATHPEHCLLSTEDGGGIMSRGETRSNIEQGLIAAYDDERVPWGATYREGWPAIAQRPFLAGGFHWTGFDYHGEPSPAIWPSASSFFGIFDLCGYPKTAYYIKKTHWKPAERTLFVFPHWTWPGREGEPIRVIAVTNAARVALSLNGTDLGERVVEAASFPEWRVPYRPGRLEAAAVWADGARETHALETVGAPVRVTLSPARNFLLADGEDTVPVEVTVVDAQGRPVPPATHIIRFCVEGPVRLAGTGNGDPNDHSPESGLERRLYHGLAQALVRHDAQAGKDAGTARLVAEADGLEPAEVRFEVRSAPEQKPNWPAADPALCLATWRLSPFTETRPDPNAVLSDNDMNSWEFFSTDSTVSFPGRHWVLLRAEFMVPEAVARRGGQLVLPALALIAECWHNGAREELRPDDSGQQSRLPLPSGRQSHTVTLLLYAATPASLYLSFAPTVTPTHSGGKS
ncbi:MAG: beta-galactosidase GalA [Verrucomicrobiota bacterium]